MSDLPKCQNAKLSELLLEMQPGFASGKKNVAGGVQQLRMNNIGVDGQLVLDLVRTVPKSVAHPKYDLAKGDILVCTTNSGKLVGKSACFNIDGRYVFSNHLTRLRVNPNKIDSQFLAHYLFLIWKKGAFTDKCKHWVNQSALPKDELASTVVPLPSIDEQKQIVNKLCHVLPKIQAIQARLDKIPVLLKRFRQSVLSAACSGRLTADWRDLNKFQSPVESLDNYKCRRIESAKTPREKVLLQKIYSHEEESTADLPEKWIFVSLNKICQSFDYGTSAKSDKKGHIPVLRMGNIQDGMLDWSDLVYTSDKEEVKKYLLKPKTVLFNRTNSPELVGKTAIYNGERPAIFAGYLIRINASEVLDADYLNICLNAPRAKEYCQSVKTDGVSQSNINAQKLGKFEVPFCSVKEQQEIVRRVEALFKFADDIEAKHTAARAKVDKLSQSILSKAFRGELH